jgi:AcrR family transcriptional regulator
MANTRAEQAERTRRAVLEHAAVLFTERGYDRTSLQDIADAMGVRKANVYYYFRAKDDILVALLEQRIAALEQLFDTAQTISDVADRQQTMITGFVEQVVVAHRTIAPVDFADPGVRRQPGVAPRLEALTERAMRIFFGGEPSVDQEAAFLMMMDLKPVLRRFTECTDDELHEILRRVCTRLVVGIQPD